MGENDDGLTKTEEIDFGMLNSSPPAKIPDENANSDGENSPHVNNQTRRKSNSLMPS